MTQVQKILKCHKTSLKELHKVLPLDLQERAWKCVTKSCNSEPEFKQHDEIKIPPVTYSDKQNWRCSCMKFICHSRGRKFTKMMFWKSPEEKTNAHCEKPAYEHLLFVNNSQGRTVFCYSFLSVFISSSSPFTASWQIYILNLPKHTFFFLFGLLQRLQNI